MIIPNSFQNPNVYVDRAMPYLTDSELRVLIYATRHILGWQDRIGKRRGHISLSMFENGFTTKEGTYYAGCGLGRHAIVAALRNLVDFGLLIRVGLADETGQEWELGVDAIQWEKLESRQSRQIDAFKIKTQKAREKMAEKRDLEKGIENTLAKGVEQSSTEGSPQDCPRAMRVASPSSDQGGLSDNTSVVAQTTPGLSDNTTPGLSDNTQSKPSSKPKSKPITRKRDKPSQPDTFQETPQMSAVIKGYLDGLSIEPVTNEYENKSTRRLAEALVKKGYTPAQVTRFTRHLQAQSYWTGKKVPFRVVAEGIAAFIVEHPDRVEFTFPLPKYHYDPALDDGTPATPEQIEQARQIFDALVKSKSANDPKERTLP